MRSHGDMHAETDSEFIDTRLTHGNVFHICGLYIHRPT